jgi:hypothetical protein
MAIAGRLNETPRVPMTRVALVNQATPDQIQ